MLGVPDRSPLAFFPPVPPRLSYLAPTRWPQRFEHTRRILTWEHWRVTATAFPNLFFIVFGTIVRCVPEHTGSSCMGQQEEWWGALLWGPGWGEGVGAGRPRQQQRAGHGAMRIWRPPSALPAPACSEPPRLDTSSLPGLSRKPIKWPLKGEAGTRPPVLCWGKKYPGLIQ